MKFLSQNQFFRYDNAAWATNPGNAIRIIRIKINKLSIFKVYLKFAGLINKLKIYQWSFSSDSLITKDSC